MLNANTYLVVISIHFFKYPTSFFFKEEMKVYKSALASLKWALFLGNDQCSCVRQSRALAYLLLFHFARVRWNQTRE